MRKHGIGGHDYIIRWGRCDMWELALIVLIKRPDGRLKVLDITFLLRERNIERCWGGGTLTTRHLVWRVAEQGCWKDISMSRMLMSRIGMLPTREGEHNM